MTSVSVIIPARNDAASLPRAVQSITEQSGVTAHEIIIAVGPSDDGTKQAAESLSESGLPGGPRVVVLDNGSGRTPDGLNLAIAATTGDVIARVDARSILPADYLRNASETMQSTGAANVGAIQWAVGQTLTERGIAAAMASRIGSGGAAYRGTTTITEVDTAYLGFFRREPLIEVGGYDNRFTRNQDAELNIRLRAAGHTIVVDPRLVVNYRPRPTLSALARQYWQYGSWRARTVRTHPASLKLRQMAAPVVVLGLLVIAAGAVVVTPWALLLAVAYIAVVLAGAVVADGLTFAERVVMALALVVMHISWGVAFLLSWCTSWRAFRPERTG